MALDLNKTELRELVRDLIEKELNSSTFKKTVKDSVSSVIKDNKILDEKEIRNVVRQMLVNFQKLLYQRQDSWKNSI